MRVVLVPLVIASVLFLGAAGSVTALTPAPEKGQKPANSNKRDAAPQAYASPQACPSVSVIIKEIPVPEAKQITAVIQQRPYGHWWQSQSAPEWALFFLTIPYVVVSICVFVVTWRAANAAESSAAAALVSAQAAKQAIHTDRPLVIVQDIDAGADFSNLSFTPKVVFRNYGNSPAILMEVCLGLQTITGDLWRAGVTQETVRQWQYQRNKIQKQVLGTNDPIIELITMKSLPRRGFDDVLEGATVQVAHGFIRYRGVFELIEPYESTFAWVYNPNSGTFVIGPKELNRTA